MRERDKAARFILLTIVPAYILLVLVALVGFKFIEREANDRSESDRSILVQRTIATCEERNVTKDAIRGTINAAIEGGNGGGGIDLTNVPGFSELDLPTQAFFRNLAEMSRDDSGQTSADRLRAYRDSLVNEDCQKVGRDLADQLDVEES